MNILDMATESFQKAIKAVVDGIKTTTDITKSNVDSIKTSTDSMVSKQDEVLIKMKNGDLKQKIAIFATPGTHYWTCPEGVTAVKLTMFGGGGGGEAEFSRNDGGSWSAYGGNGGSFVDGKFLSVTPGTTYPLIVGAGGAGGTPDNNFGAGFAGGTSSAFGLVCVGGAGGSDFPRTVQPSSNSPLVTRGRQGSYRDLQDTSLDAVGPILGRHGRNHEFAGGGAPGYGDGGDAVTGYSSVTHTTAGIGAGGGALAIQPGGSRGLRACPGGNGIIIIEY